MRSLLPGGGIIASLPAVVTIFLLCGMAEAVEVAEAAGSPKHSRFYVEGGILFGTEKKMPDYEASRFRFLVDLGFEKINRPFESVRALDRIGLAYNMAFGKDDIRHCLGPKLTWKLSDKWSLHNMAGVAVSGPEKRFDVGFHANNALVFNDIVSIVFIYQALPVKDERLARDGGILHSYYGGVAIHGRAGAAVTLTAAAILIALGIAFAAGGGGMGGS